MPENLYYLTWKTKWEQGNVQAVWKVEVCFMAESTPSPFVEAEVTSKDLSLEFT